MKCLNQATQLLCLPSMPLTSLLMCSIDDQLPIDDQIAIVVILLLFPVLLIPNRHILCSSCVYFGVCKISPGFTRGLIWSANLMMFKVLNHCLLKHKRMHQKC